MEFYCPKCGYACSNRSDISCSMCGYVWDERAYQELVNENKDNSNTYAKYEKKKKENEYK